MQVRHLTALFIVFLSTFVSAQVIPREGSFINYTIVGFSFPSQKNGSYKFEISAGFSKEEKQFIKQKLGAVTCKTNQLIYEVPAFGRQYTWRIIYSAPNQKTIAGPFYHFATGSIPEADTNYMRLRVARKATKYKDAYVLLDGTKMMYDMAGRPVWYLPLIEGKSFTPRDLKVTSSGSLTFLDGDAYDISYDGRILWKAPNDGHVSGERPEGYHHEFTKLANGHYMVYATESLFCNLNPDGTVHINFDDRDAHPRSAFGVLIEYDDEGKVVWAWRSSRYFDSSDLKYYKTGNNAPVIDLLHENSFYFDEVNQVISISFKNLNRVIRIKYPEGTVLGTYGDLFRPGDRLPYDPAFCGQHSVSFSSDGNLYVFNNNICHPGNFPSVEKLKLPNSDGEPLKRVWDYECVSTEHLPEGYPSGGNVRQLHDGDVFISTAGPDNQVFIVNGDKKILWSAYAERWSDPDKKWLPVANYRASIINNRKELEHLISQSMKSPFPINPKQLSGTPNATRSSN